VTKRTAKKSAWQTKELATCFLEEVRAAIPGAQLQLELLGRIAEAWQPCPVLILDLGCGDGLLGRLLLDLFPTAHGIFVDFSEPMLQALRAKLTAASRATIIKADFSTAAWLAKLEDQGPLDLVVSGFAIHHQPDRRKRELYDEIYRLLSPAGVFLNLEHVASQTPAGHALFDELFIDNCLKFHRAIDPAKTREQVAADFHKRPDKKENILAPVSVQIEWLRQIGFQDVDCFFKLFELALFGGRRT
jgi:tRNA (cmo5U34)-methyltransferase